MNPKSVYILDDRVFINKIYTHFNICSQISLNAGQIQEKNSDDNGFVFVSL